MSYIGIAERTLKLFLEKQKDYAQADGSQVADEWGVMAQFMKMNDKLKKLRRPLYEEEILRLAVKISPGDFDSENPITVREFQFEGTQEILMDLIGHAWITLKMLEDREEGNCNA